MGMDRINGSPFVRQRQIDAFRGAERQTKGTGAREGAIDDAPPAASDKMSDKAEISENALRLIDLRKAVDTGRAALAALPDVREERLDEVRRRLDAGYYQSTQVLEGVAKGVADVLRGIDKL